jgi:hypothetical protein
MLTWTMSGSSTHNPLMLIQALIPKKIAKMSRRKDLGFISQKNCE